MSAAWSTNTSAVQLASSGGAEISDETLIAESLVESVVKDTLERLDSDPQFSQLAVAHFVEEQPDLVRYLTARLRNDDQDTIVESVFHAELIAACLRAHLDVQTLPAVSFDALDKASHDIDDFHAHLAEKAKPLADYLFTNLERADLRQTVSLLALALLGVLR